MLEIKTNVGKLIIAPSHLGNKKDLPNRVIELFKRSNNIIVEKEEQFYKDLDFLGITLKKKPIEFQHSDEFYDMVTDKLDNNEDVVLIVEMGYPGTADPGSMLIKHLHTLKYPVDIIAGPSIGPMAIALSGIVTGEKAYVVLELFGLEQHETLSHLNNIKDLPYCSVILDHKTAMKEILQKTIDVFEEDREIALLVNAGHEEGSKTLIDKASSLIELIGDTDPKEFFGKLGMTTLVIPPKPQGFTMVQYKV
jgi:16S rRNA C1402 (ribose-2'-O) methylase RsmI